MATCSDSNPVPADSYFRSTGRPHVTAGVKCLMQETCVNTAQNVSCCIVQHNLVQCIPDIVFWRQGVLVTTLHPRHSLVVYYVQ